MKKSTISKLKSIFGSKKGKRQLQQQQSTKSSRSASPEPAGDASPNNGEFRPFIRTPPPSRAGPPPSPPVPTHPVAPVAPEASVPLPLMPCQVCGRTFVPQSLAKHVKICEKMTIKKRKTFDSSRQRREGTDLEQYLPKNFGLPENSPFLEKSPPPTAKPTPKPKVQSVRAAITKPMAELQKCPHCSRAFGVRAFERHVEWCADKAKILPAAPAQPPPHIADAKQRLNARTQYKAPPVGARGRRSSQTRDKSSNSRSASVESTRGISPPREFGDYRHVRTRASESVSSNDCHDDNSPHIPVIRNSRNTQHNSSGDANVRARQARLARDISSTSVPKDSQNSTVQQSNTDPNVNKTESQNKSKNRINAKKQQQIKKLEEISKKYNERMKDRKDETKTALNNKEKSLIPIPKKNVRKEILQTNDDNQSIFGDTEIIEVEKDIKENIHKSKVDYKIQQKRDSNIAKERGKLKKIATGAKGVNIKNTHSREKSPLIQSDVKIAPVTQEKKSKFKKKDPSKLLKENSMSLDSLEEPPDSVRNCQSIGINTELLCVPCVIHENLEQKQSGRRTKNKKTSIITDYGLVNHELKIELLYKNPTMTSSGDLRSIEKCESTDSKENLSLCSSRHSIITSGSQFVADNIDSCLDVNNLENDYDNLKPTNEQSNILLKLPDDDSKNNIVSDLSAEIFEESYERDKSNEELVVDSVDQKSDTEIDHRDNNIECRYGSGETYTKFTEDPADLEEFINMTDKLMTNHKSECELFDIDKDLNNIHTPTTNSLEAINKDNPDHKTSDTQQKHIFSDTFQELKNNLKELLENARGDIKENPNDISKNNDDEDTRKVCDMEHITVYELKFYETTSAPDKKETPEIEDIVDVFKLPSIENNNKPERKMSSCNKKRINNIYKPNRKYKMLGDQNRDDKDYQTFIVKQNQDDSSDGQSMSSGSPPLKLPRIENKKARLDDNYDPFISAARQMKELMASDTNIPKKLSTSSKDLNRTLPVLRNCKEKGLSSQNSNNTKMMKDTLNKSYQKTPTLQRMKSFGSTSNDNNNSFGGRCSSFRINRNDNKKSSHQLNTTFTKSSKENISTIDKSFFNRNSNLNRSFSSYTASNYSTPKIKEKIPKITTSMYHSFQRTTIKQPIKLDKIKKDDERKIFVNLDSILTDDNSSMTDSHYIDPRLINENDNLPINVNTILNNPDIISSMESLLTTENLPAKFESFSSSNLINNNKNLNGITNTNHNIDKFENNNNNNKDKTAAPVIDDLSAQYDKIMSSLEQSITSKTSIRDDESLCEDFDLEEFMTSFDEEIIKHKLDNKRTCSSTTRIVKKSELTDSNRTSELNSVSSSPKIANGMIPVNKSMSLNFSSNNNVNENLFPSSVKRSTSLLDSIQKKNVQKLESVKSRHKTDQLEQDLMQSLKDFDKLYAADKNEEKRNSVKYNTSYNGTTKRDNRLKSDRKAKNDILNGNHTPNGKSSNDSAYSSLNRISPSKLSLCTSKEPNGVATLEQVPAGSDSSSQKDDARSISSDEFLAMERSAEAQEHPTFKEVEQHAIIEKRVSSRASRRSPTWRGGELSSSGSEASLPAPVPVPVPAPAQASAPRLSRFCHECGTKFSLESAKFCIECGAKRLHL